MPHAQCRTATFARYSLFGICAVRDVVLLQNNAADIVAAEVWVHGDVVDGSPGMEPTPLALVSIWDPIEINRERGVASWRRRCAPSMIPTWDIVATCIFRAYTDGTAITLLPGDV